MSTTVRWSTFALVSAGVGSLVLVGDELLKALVRANLPVCDVRLLASCARLDLWGPLRLVRTDNAGSAFGYAQGLGLWVVLAALGVLLIPLYVRRLRSVGLVAALAAGLQAGGALGNLIDRLVLGGATDMLTLGTGVVWNLADVALVLGTVMRLRCYCASSATRPNHQRTDKAKRSFSQPVSGSIELWLRAVNRSKAWAVENTIPDIQQGFITIAATTR